MLYKYEENGNIEMLPSYDFKDLGGIEKDLENMLANNLNELYSEDEQLMPIFQERKRQPEPDLLALDRNGNLIIFELKRGEAPKDAIIQIMRYCQEYGRYSYYDLNNLYKTYMEKKGKGLQKESELEEKYLQNAHTEAFNPDHPLPEGEFNRKQKLIIIGSSSEDELRDKINYWKEKGIDIDYIPYRFYEINNEKYFEFFTKPYDYHINVKDKKGIIFDTNRTYDSDAIWDMLKYKKVSAYGSQKKCVKSFCKGDYVLYYHKGWGIVGAGIITSSKPKEITSNEEMYMDVDLLTPQVENNDNLKYIPVSELKGLLNKNFFWAKTTKVPYLSIEESEKVVKRLKEKYNGNP